MRRFTLVLFGLFVLSQSGSAAVYVKWDEQVDGAIDAVPVSTQEPIFPVEQIGYRNDAWVWASYVVGLDGQTHHIVVHSEKGKELFEAAAYAAIKKWAFTPATVNGRKVEQSIRQEIIFFKNPKAKSSIDEYDAEQINDAFNAVQSGSDTLRRAIAGVNAIGGKSLSIHKYSEFFKGLEKVEGPGNFHKARALQHLTNATHLPDLKLEGNAFPEAYMRDAALQYGIQLAIQLNKPMVALRKYDQLVDLHGVVEPDHVMARAISELKETLDGPAATQVRGYVGEPCEDCDRVRRTWYHTPYRSGIEIRNIHHWQEGEVARLDRISVQCDYYFGSISVTGEGAWTLPEKTGSCDLYFEGAQGTEFDLIEPPIDH